MDWQTAVVGVLVLINAVASLAVVRSPVLSGGQRVVQLGVIWLLPLIGAVICLAFAITEARAVRDSLSPAQVSVDHGDGGFVATGAFAGDCFGGGDACGGGDGGGGGD